MTKTFRYRLYPTKKQMHLLSEQLEECRWVWNTFLAERKQLWEERQETISCYDQQAELPSFKVAVRPTLAGVNAQAVQEVAVRLKKAFDAFFRRLKAGETPGYPRFKGRGRYESITFPQMPDCCHMTAANKRLWVSKVGDIKMMYHRPLEGTPKTATIRRMPTGKWFVTIACEWEPTPLPPTGHEVGIDVGLKTFATCSDGVEIANQRFFRTEENALAKAQRKHQVAIDAHKVQRSDVTKQVKHDHPELTDETHIWQQVSQDGSERVAWRARRKRRKVVARVHERITWRRDNFAHQESRKLVNRCDLIAVEDLTITTMVKNPKLAKSIHDVAWGQFTALLGVKAAWARCMYVAVNPAYTSTDCSGCGHRKTDLTLADRIYHCVACGLVIDRDLNAAINILARGRASLGLVP